VVFEGGKAAAQARDKSCRKALISGPDSDAEKSHFSYSFHALGIESDKGSG
jgi:hypothetical protein